jgi:hypothetical protein
MARGTVGTTTWSPDSPRKRTSIGGGKPKMQTMNKHKKRSYKAYRGQGR